MKHDIVPAQRLASKPPRRVGWRLLVLPLVLGLTLAGGCGTLPPLEGRMQSSAAIETDDTRLGQALAPRVAASGGNSGLHMLADARDAFAARALLAQAAERTLDVQYYIWHGDMSGSLLFESLRAAADRGVRVRLLLDDNGTGGIDATLAALDAHPEVEVRLFNPFVIREPKMIGYLTDFSRLNRRMHNKSFTADNQATIIGGRNVGDEYFGATDGTVFVDLDVLAVGPVVKQVSADFDRYWSSGSSYPAAAILAPATAAQREELATAAHRLEQAPAAAAYLDAIRRSSFATDLLQGRLALEWAPTRMVSDDPAKGLGLAEPEGNLTHELREVIGDPAEEVDLISAYFVPTKAGVEAFTGLVRRGVTVKILTNSLEATDVAAVHAGYAKRRTALLEGGVALYELRLLGGAPTTSAQENKSDRSLVRGSSSGSSLHAKTFTVDGRRVFIGSFNFDPRSQHLNTELGFVIDSPAMAQAISGRVAQRLPEASYQVLLSEQGGLYWLERRDGREIRHEVEPGTSIWLRSGVWLMSLLPIEWML
jgi:putative cardiolipin synthase